MILFFFLGLKIRRKGFRNASFKESDNRFQDFLFCHVSIRVTYAREKESLRVDITLFTALLLIISFPKAIPVDFLPVFFIAFSSNRFTLQVEYEQQIYNRERNH
jgi:hypothetical protein